MSDSLGIRSWLQRRMHALRCDEGATLVEMAISFSVFATLLIAMLQMSLAFYAYHFVSDAAREATRFAMVRGAKCTGNVSSAYCSPASGNTNGADNADIQAYVNALGYPFASQLSTNTTWLSLNSGSSATWSSCGSTKCNAAGNMVQVTVSYDFPIGIPGWSVTSIPVSSTSSVVIAQ
ncbi:MAG TPA: TadE/TadG family type IV pilus assembly protein [Terracidiphilus sp.]|nr:TadE/TadG family type IV pilus assembly protein [Terracidiphilus sp.]